MDLASRRRSVLATAAFVLFCLVLYANFVARPLVAEPWQWADDGLFLRLGTAISRWVGKPLKLAWLGPYDEVILAKAPLFGVWLALVHGSGLPLPVADFALLLAGVPLLAAAVRPLAPVKGWRLYAATFFLVALPILPREVRLLRTVLQAALTSACLVSLAGLALRAGRDGAHRTRWAIATGAFLGLCYLNREEATWLLPSVGVAIVGTAALCLARGERAAAARVVAGSALAFLVPVLAVATLNRASYGFATTTVRRAPGFTRAYQALTSLEPSRRKAYIPVVEETRLRAYELSPTFARLRPFLEGSATDHMARNPGHFALAGYPPGREFFVSTFEWALRQAAAQAGEKTAAGADAMFGRVADELERAIRDRRIGAGAHGPSLLAGMRPGDEGRIVAATLRCVEVLLRVEGIDPPANPRSSGEAADVFRMAGYVHAELAPIGAEPPQTTRPRGIFAAGVLVDRIVYPASFLAVPVAVGLALTRFRRRRHAAGVALAGVALFGAPLAWSAVIGVVHVLGWPLLNWPGYPQIGLVSVSVVAAFVVVAAPSALRLREGAGEVEAAPEVAR